VSRHYRDLNLPLSNFALAVSLRTSEITVERVGNRYRRRVDSHRIGLAGDVLFVGVGDLANYHCHREPTRQITSADGGVITRGRTEASAGGIAATSTLMGVSVTDGRERAARAAACRHPHREPLNQITVPTPAHCRRVNSGSAGGNTAMSTPMGVSVTDGVNVLRAARVCTPALMNGGG
jgi:hypothetical protein